MIFGGPQGAVRTLRREYSLDPCRRLGLQGFVIQYPCQRQQAVDPVWTALPGVAVPAQPGVGGPHHFGINFVQMPGEAVSLTPELLLQPSACLDGAQRKLGIRAWLERSTVKGLRPPCDCRKQYRRKQEVYT